MHQLFLQTAFSVFDNQPMSDRFKIRKGCTTNRSFVSWFAQVHGAEGKGRLFPRFACVVFQQFVYEHGMPSGPRPLPAPSVGEESSAWQ